MSRIWVFLPDQFMPLAIAGIGLALILGIIGLRKAATLIGGICLLLITAPFFDALFDGLPSWLFVLMVPIVIGWIGRWVLGERAFGHMVGSLAADVVRFAFLFPFRLIGLLFRRRY